MRDAERHPFIVVDSTLGEAGLCPYLPITLTYGDRSATALGLLDTGAMIDVLPYQIGVELGAVWEQQRMTSMDLFQPIEVSPHAREKMLDRGASENEIKVAIRTGNPEPARKGRLMFRKNFAFNSWWRSKHYAIKQVAPIVAEEADRLVVVTVFVYYF